MAIHRPVKPRRTSLPICELYAEDYAAIHAALCESPHNASLTLAIKEQGQEEWVSVDTPADLRSPDLALQGIRFQLSKEPAMGDGSADADFVVQLDNETAFIRDSFQDAVHTGITQNLLEILRRRERRWKKLVVTGADRRSVTILPLALAVGVAATPLAPSLLMDATEPESDSPPAAAIADGLAPLLWLVWALAAVLVLALLVLTAMSTTTRVRLNTRTRAEMPTFTERNRDEIVISAASTLVGFLLGVGTTIWLT